MWITVNQTNRWGEYEVGFEDQYEALQTSRKEELLASREVLINPGKVNSR